VRTCDHANSPSLGLRDRVAVHDAKVVLVDVSDLEHPDKIAVHLGPQRFGERLTVALPSAVESASMF
jgi:hypothetical protein